MLWNFKNFADVHVHMSIISFDACKNFLDILAGQGVTHVALQSLTYRSIAYNLSVLYWKEKYKDMKISAFGMIHNQDFYSAIPYEEQAKALIAMGCDGIKFMYAPGTRKKLAHSVSDGRYDKMFAYLQENNIPVLMHVNDPEKFWEPRVLTPYEIERGWGYCDGTYLSKQEIYDEVFALLDRFPRLRMTFAHFFFLSCFPDEAERVMEKYPNVCFDLTPGWEMYLGFSQDIPRWRTFFAKYADRILFGTDCNDTKDFNEKIYALVWQGISHDATEFQMPCYGGHTIRGLGLSEDILQKICFDNYQSFVGDVKPVNMPLLRRAAERVQADIRGMEDEKSLAAAEWIETFLAEQAK